MKRATDEVLNDHQPVKKLKVDLEHKQNVNGHDVNVNGWSKVEKRKKKKETKAAMGKQNVSSFQFKVHHAFVPFRMTSIMPFVLSLS
jgi:hypothetical protein